MKDLFALPAPKPQVINLKSFNIDSTKWRAESLQSDSDKWTNAAMVTFWYAVWFLNFAGFFPLSLNQNDKPREVPHTACLNQRQPRKKISLAVLKGLKIPYTFISDLWGNSFQNMRKTVLRQASALQVDSLPAEPPGKARRHVSY